MQIEQESVVRINEAQALLIDDIIWVMPDEERTISTVLGELNQEWADLEAQLKAIWESVTFQDEPLETENKTLDDFLNEFAQREVR